MIDIRQKRISVIKEHQINEIISNINLCYSQDRSFILIDVAKIDYEYNRYTTKGLLLGLIYLGYIEITGLFNGNKNYVYRCLKEIPINRSFTNEEENKKLN